MSKFRTSILLIGILISVIAASLLTVLVLYATGVIVTDPIELVLTISDEKKEYDGTPLTARDYRITDGELLKGHELKVEFLGSRTNAGESESDLSVKVVDKKGFDVTKEYSFKTEKGKLTVTPLEINVELHDETVTYNGKQIDFNDYLVTEGALVPGHKLAAISETTLFNAGDTLTKNDLTILVYDLYNNPVTENYVLNFEMEGTIQVAPRAITIKPAGGTKIYDGLPLSCNSYEIMNGSLALGQTATAEYFGIGGDEASITDAGELRIQIDSRTFRILDDGTDVTGNYDIEYVTDYLRIEKKWLTVTAKSGRWVYDGKEHTFEGDTSVYFVEGLVAGDSISRVNYSGSITDVGTEVNAINGIEFANGKGGNYEIVNINGTLEVTPMSVTVYSKYIYKGEYDGQTLGDYIKDLNESVYDTSPALPAGFKLEGQTGIENISDAGTGVYSLDRETVKVLNSAQDDCTKNFLFSFVSGQYTIDKKPVNVKLETITKTYDGETVTLDINTAFDVKALPDGLTPNDFELVCPEDGYTDAGSYTYSANFVPQSEKANNYDVKVAVGAVFINKLNVSLSLDGIDSKLYDGTKVTLEMGKIIIENGVAALEKIGASITSFVYDVDDSALFEHAVTLTSVSFADLYGKDITSNLNIDYSGAKVNVEVTAKPVQIYVPGYSIQEGQEWYMPLESFVGLSSPLAAGDEFVNIENAVQIGNGYVYIIIANLKIVNKYGANVTRMYNFTNEGEIVMGTYEIISPTYP